VIRGNRIGLIRTTKSPTRTTFALNRPETERALKAYSEGRVALIVIVAVRTNADGRREYAHVEASSFYENVLRNKPTIPGEFGDFWSLTEREITGEEPPL
jgi:hypothetical protein